MLLPEPLSRLTSLFSRFPGVGEKTAQRFVMHLMASDSSLASDLGRELMELREHLGPCERCGFIAERPSEPNLGPLLCRICGDARRESTTICVVAKVQDLLAIERSRAHLGRYFVLGKLLSPLDGVGPDSLPMDRLLSVLEESGATEVILATPPSVEGEATALFISSELSKRGLTLSRIASGIPHGGDLEFADQITLGRAILGRRAF